MPLTVSKVATLLVPLAFRPLASFIDLWTPLAAGMSGGEPTVSRFLVEPKSNASPLLQGSVILGPIIDSVASHGAPFLL